MFNFGIIGHIHRQTGQVLLYCGCVRLDSRHRQLVVECPNVPHPVPTTEYLEISNTHVLFDRAELRRIQRASQLEAAVGYLQRHLQRHPKKLNSFLRKAVVATLEDQLSISEALARDAIRTYWQRLDDGQLPDDLPPEISILEWDTHDEPDSDPDELDEDN